MKRTFIFVATLVFASTIPAFAQTTNEDTLLQRLATAQGGGKAQVFVGKLPTDLPKIPLPDGSIIGSVHRRTDLRNGTVADSYDLFYDATPQTMSAYQATLTGSGWTSRQTAGAGGFVSSKGPDFGFYCKANSPLILIRTGEDPGDVHISVTLPSESADAMCGGPEAMARMITSAMQPSLPALHAPPGVTMSVANIDTPNGRSAAYIQNGNSAGALLDAFTAQMIACGWHPGAKLTGTAIATQAFQRFDDKKTRWQAVIMVNAVDGKPGDFSAYVEASHGTGPSGEFQSFTIRTP